MLFKWMLPHLLWIPLTYASVGYEEPWGKDTNLHYPVAISPSPPSSIPVWLAERVIHFHQKVLSPVDGPRSHFRPSSSAYMHLAMKKHGFFKGFILGCDRLLRENDADWVYQTIEMDGQVFKYNPVP